MAKLKKTAQDTDHLEKRFSVICSPLNHHIQQTKYNTYYKYDFSGFV